MTQVKFALQAMDEAFDRRSWHGTNLRGSIRRVKAVQAAWRPGCGRHNIWEIVVHAAYWKYAVRRRIRGEKRGSFPLAGSDWFQRPDEVSETKWKTDIDLLEEEHRRLREAVSSLDDAALQSFAGKGTTSIGTLLRGIVAHDLYHAGQIQLLKRLYSSANQKTR